MKALTVGGAMVDTIAIIESDRIERITMRNADMSFLLLEEGRKTEASEISTHAGGGAINAAVGMARLGHDVAALVKLGQDERADMILSRLQAEGVSGRWAIRDPRQPTGASVMVAAHDRNAAIFTFRGANTLLEPEDIRDDALAVDLVYVSGLSNKSADCFPAIVRGAKARGAMVATNPGIRQLSTRHGALQDCLSCIDLLSINRVEADTLVPSLVARFGEGGPGLPLETDEQPPALVARGLEGGGFEMTLTGFVQAIHQLGPRWVVLTDGRHGAYLSTGERLLYCPVAETKVAGTAGAGDAFSSTLAAALAAQQAPELALRSATLNAASVIGHIDTQTGLLSAKKLTRQLKLAGETLAIREWALEGPVSA